MRVVLDANTLASGALASAGAIAQLMDRWLTERRFTVVSSDMILGEVERALRKRYFASRLVESDRIAFIDLLRHEALMVVPRTEVGRVAADPADDHVLAMSVDGKASYLVTGDHALLALAEFRGVRIVTARELLTLLDPS
jgi:putative PIN family toxin of toxin-antitoxin system